MDENKICDSIIDKIFIAIQECPMALCDLSSRNPNVLYELGIRQAYDKPVVLVKDDITTKIFDVSGINTIEYKSNRLYEDVMLAREEITEALMATKNNKSNSNSLVRIVKAKKAVIDTSEVSKDDKIDIALSSMLNEINSIKKYVYDYTNNDKSRVNSIEAYNNEYRIIRNKLNRIDHILQSNNEEDIHVYENIYSDLKDMRVRLMDRKGYYPEDVYYDLQKKIDYFLNNILDKVKATA